MATIDLTLRLHRWILPLWLLLSLAVVMSPAASGKESAPTPDAYYGNFDSPSLENITYEDVEKLLLHGRPFVVIDGARGLPMATWDCDFVKKEFPDSRIRHEGGKSDVNGVPMSSNWTGTAKQFAGAKQFPPGAPLLRPFYWDIVKALDEKHRKWGKNPNKVIQKIESSSAVPYWLPKQSARHMGSSSEMWFHPPGAGAPAHMDPHCHTTVSFCFSGSRKWRMMMPPAEPHKNGYFDGEVYGYRDPSRKNEWKPTFSLEAPAGSAVVVYPGMIHETLSTGEQCSSSISQTFQRPVAAGYFRAFWPRFSLIHEDVGRCGYLVEGLVNFASGKQVAAAKEKGARKAGETFAAQADADKDGVVSPDEIANLRRRDQYSIDELVSFHDVDGDGKIQVQEVVESWIMYATTMHRVNEKRRRGEL